MLGDGITARVSGQQVVKAPGALGIGAGAAVDGQAVDVVAGQGDADAGQAAVADARTVVAGIEVDVSGQRADEFAKIIAGRAGRRQAGNADAVGQVAGATGAGRGAAIGVAQGLGFAHRIRCAAGQGGKAVAAHGVAAGAGQGRARAGATGVQRQRHGGDAAVGGLRVEAAIAIAIHIHRAADLRRGDLAKVVLAAQCAGRQADGTDGAGHAAHRRGAATQGAGDGLAIQRWDAGDQRLGQLFGDPVATRARGDQVVEAPGAVGVGLHAQIERLAEQVGAREGDGDAGQRGVADAAAVVVAVEEDEAGQGARDLTKVVAAGAIGGQ